MAKIAVELERAVQRRAANGGPGHLTARVLAQGEGWRVADVICTSGPQDRPFEERHAHVAIAMVVAGSFQYRSQPQSKAPCRPGVGRELMTPGSLLLGNPGQYFECGHEHGAGDRCLSFLYSPDYFERVASDAGTLRSHAKPDFRVLRLPPLRALSPLVARACAGLVGSGAVSSDETATTGLRWEEFGLQLAAQAAQLASGLAAGASDVLPSAAARITRALRMIERNPHARLTLARLAREAGLSPYHFLRTFERVTGVTPHQYILRARLREAATRLAAEPAKILDIALDCGFGDVSNFNHAFRAEFGASPRGFKLQHRSDPH